MLWFRHFSDARNNPKFIAVQNKLGDAGYARVFKLFEIVADRGGKGEAFAPRISLSEPHTNLGWIAHELGINRRSAKFTLKVCAEVGLIDPEAYRQNVLYIPQMREYVDEWTRKKRPSGSGATPEQIRSKSPQSQKSESKPETDSESQSQSAKADVTANRDVNTLKVKPEFDFEVFALRWRDVVDRPPERTKTNQELYHEACREYGEEAVLARVELWADDQDEGFVRSKVGAWKFLKDGVHDYDEEEKPKRNPFPRL
jgi:hypothetical protein